MNYKNGRPVVVGDVARGYAPGLVHLVVGVVLAFTQDGIRDDTVQLSATRTKKLRRSSDDGTDSLNVGEMAVLTVPSVSLELEYRDETPYPVPNWPETLVQGDVPAPITPREAAAIEFQAGAALAAKGQQISMDASPSAHEGFSAMLDTLDFAEKNAAAVQLAPMDPPPETKPSEPVVEPTAAPVVDGTVRAELADATEPQPAVSVPVVSDGSGEQVSQAAPSPTDTPAASP